MEEFLSEILRGGKKGGVESGPSSRSKSFTRKEGAKPIGTHSGEDSQRSFKDVVLGRNMTPSLEQTTKVAVVLGGNPTHLMEPFVSDGYRPRVEDNRTKKTKSTYSLDWGRVIVCERFVVHQPWREVEASLQKTLGKTVCLVPFLCNKALLTCENAKEAAQIAHLGVLPMIGFPDIVLSGWWDSIKDIERKVVSYGGWIALEGLPPHLWTRDFFLEIGDACGGLEAIDRKTANLDFLLEAKIKIKQNSIGFIPEFVEAADGDFIFKIKIRQISPARRPKLQEAKPVDSRHRLLSRCSSMEAPKTLQTTGTSLPPTVISISEPRSRPSMASRDGVPNEVPASPTNCAFGRKQSGLLSEGSWSRLTEVPRDGDPYEEPLSPIFCVFGRKHDGLLSEGDCESPDGTHIQEKNGEFTTDGQYFIRSNSRSTIDCGPSVCLVGGFCSGTEMAGEVVGFCGPFSETKSSNAICGRSFGPGSFGPLFGLNQFGAFTWSPRGPFSFTLSQQSSLIHIGPSSPKFFVKFGDPAFGVKRFNHLFPSDFGSRRYPCEAGLPMFSEASNLQFLDEVSDSDTDSDLVLGPHDPLSSPEAKESVSIDGNFSSSKFFTTVDFDYLSHVSPAQDATWSQGSDSEENFGESPHQNLASTDPIESGEGFLQKLFSVSEGDSPKVFEVDDSVDEDADDQSILKDPVVKNKVLKYCRRKGSSRTSAYGESSGRSSEFLSKMKISLLPLKKSLFPGKSLGRRAGCGESRKNKRASVIINEDNQLEH
ncbi:hypothetical protein FF1_047165 [Malus domestica]